MSVAEDFIMPYGQKAWQHNTAFSKLVPKLQLAWDSTSSGLLKECPRKYELVIVEGYVSRTMNVHLKFGLIYHSSMETYDHAKAQGKSHDEAQALAVQHALLATWDSDTNRPWVSDDTNKNRFTLVRSIIWYLEQFKDDAAETVILANGKPAVELSFRFETTYKTSDGEPFLLCGHLDRVAKVNTLVSILDRKTTKHLLDDKFFSSFSPDNQFSIYALAGKIVYNLPLQGILVDGAQIAVTFTRFSRQPVPRTEAQLNEFYADLGVWLRHAEGYARADYWPMNDKSCGNYGGCPFRPICSKPPVARDVWLQASFQKRVWDPLQARGDV